MSFQRNGAAARRHSRAMAWGAWLMALPQRMLPPPLRLMQIGSAFWQSRALHAAARLDLASHLGSDTLTVEALATRAGAQPDALRRLLRLLMAMGVFAEAGPGRVANNALSAPLGRDHPDSVRAMVLMHNSEEMSRPWQAPLELALRQGGVPFERAHGQPFYDYLDSHPEFDALFAEAMDCVESLAGDGFATDFDWGRFRRVIDVGGGKGSKAMAILRAWPDLEALVFDRPAVVAAASPLADASLAPRLHWEGGDFMAGVPLARDAADIYLLSAVLHGLDDAAASGLLRTLAHAAGDSGARVAVLELVVPDKPDLASASFDMQMLMATHGRERDLPAWSQLVAGSGWRLEEVVTLRALGKLLVLAPAHGRRAGVQVTGKPRTVTASGAPRDREP